MVIFKEREYNCPMEMTFDLIGGKWKVLILWNLNNNTLRFNEFRRLFPKLSHKMLSQQLKELEADGIITRKVYPQVPPKVEYSLTGFGNTLIPILLEMNKWGINYVNGKIKEI